MIYHQISEIVDPADLPGQEDHREIIILHERRALKFLVRPKIAVSVDGNRLKALRHPETGVSITPRRYFSRRLS